MSELEKTSYIVGYYDGATKAVKKIHDWLMDDKREPARTHFSAGDSRNLAKEIEFRLKHEKSSKD